MRRGGFVGNIPLSGAGTFTLSLAAMPAGAFATMKIKIQLTGCKSSAAAFSLSQTGLLGDDVDTILLDAISFIQVFLDRESQLVDNSLTSQDFRTALMILNGGIDVQLIGSNIVVSSGTAATLTIACDLPLSLDRFITPDGRIFAQGSLRFSNGGQIIASIIKVANTGLVLANGTLVYTGLTIQVVMVPIEGPASLVGPSYYCRKVQGYPNAISYQGKQFLFVGLSGSAYGATYAQQGINTQGQQEVSLSSPDDQASAYLVDHPLWGNGDDPSFRFTPVFWTSRNTQFANFPTPTNSRIQVPGASNLTTLEIEAVPAPAGVQASVAAAVNGGGAVAASHPSPPSVAPGTGVSAGTAAMLPVSFHLPANAPAGSTIHPNAGSVQATAMVRGQARLAPAVASPTTASPAARRSAFARR